MKKLKKCLTIALMLGGGFGVVKFAPGKVQAAEMSQTPQEINRAL